jgi:CBS domain-containing protein
LHLVAAVIDDCETYGAPTQTGECDGHGTEEQTGDEEDTEHSRGDDDGSGRDARNRDGRGRRAQNARREIGDVIILEDRQVCGIVTDRDIVVRGIALGHDPAQTRLGEICSRELTTVPPSGNVAVVMRLMKEKALRRLPVVEDGQLVGIVSLGDLAVKRDRPSVLGEISAAPANR